MNRCQYLHEGGKDGRNFNERWNNWNGYGEQGQWNSGFHQLMNKDDESESDSCFSWSEEVAYEYGESEYVPHIENGCWSALIE